MCLIRMAITESRKKSDLEKRLKILRRQISVREKVSDIQYSVSSQKIATDQIPQNSGNLPGTDLAYLSHDLTKILMLSSAAIGFQFILFFLLKNHLLNLNFF